MPEAATKLELIRYAGIVGMGGAGFPTGVKLDTDLHGGYVLVNAAECEPGLEHNIRQLEEQGEKTLRGIAICMEITGAGQAIIAVKRKHERAIRLLHGLLKEYKNISLHLLPDIYPMGEERAVVRECLGIELSTTQLPTAANAVVLNAETVLRVAEAVEDRRPCFSKNLTVRGQLHGGSGAHVFMDVPVGVSVGALLERAGGIDTDVCPYGEILMGEPFWFRQTFRIFTGRPLGCWYAPAGAAKPGCGSWPKGCTAGWPPSAGANRPCYCTTSLERQTAGRQNRHRCFSNGGYNRRISSISQADHFEDLRP